MIAIIPARGGSKRILKKNIYPLLNKPMIVWTIEAAIKCGEFEKIYVNTDDTEIAEIAVSNGAEVPFLRKRHADDHSTVSEATISYLQELISIGEIEENDSVVQLMANCPLRDHSDISNAIRFFKTNNNQFQISCFKYGFMNPWWAMKEVDGVPEPIFSDEMRFSRSQDLPDLYCPTGAIWIAKINKLIKENSFYGKGYKLHEINWVNAIDIDDMEDMSLAEYYLGMKLSL